MRSIDFENLESVLLDAILKGAGLQEMFDGVYSCLKLPLICFDTTFHMLAYAFPRPFYYSNWEEIAAQGSASESVIVENNYLEYQEKMYEHGRSQLFDSGTCEGYPQACGPVMAGGRLAAYCGIMVEDCLTGDALKANDLLARASARLIQDRYRAERGGAVERLLINNESGPAEAESLSGALPPPYAFVIFSAEGRGVSTLEYIRGRLCGADGGAVGCLAGEGRLYMLLGGLSRPGEIKERLKQLNGIARLYGVRAGTSDIFEPLEEMSERRGQALLALSAGGEGPVNTFRAKYPVIVARCAVGRYGREASSLPALKALGELDCGSDCEYMRTLRLYLKNFRRPAATAEAMGLHRNTVINRIRKIEELLGADLADADTAAAFQLGLELRELAGGGEGGHGHG